MTLTIQPPHQLPTSAFQPQLNGVQQITIDPDTTKSRDRSPGAPEYSPITPKPQPALPAVTSQQAREVEGASIVDPSTRKTQTDGETVTAAIAPTVAATPDVPPPSQPFSGAESIDGLALRAAISSLQFQRQKAREDIRSLQAIKGQALADPEHYIQELVAGRVKEQRHEFGSARDVLDARDETQELASDAMDEDMTDANPNGEAQSGIRTLPGPQEVVRMPHINWDKYNIMGEPLDVLHEQQRRFPGTAPFQQNKGREFSVTAPYSPFHDNVDGQTHTRKPSDGSRKDSGPSSVVNTPVTAEHPYETRRSSKYQAP